MIKTLTGTLAASTMTALSVLGATQAEAACAPASGVNTPPPGTTVTCSGSNAATYGDATQSGLTINVLSGASVISATGDGFKLNANNTVANNGTVQSTSGVAINSLDALSVTNSGTISGVAAGIAADTGFLSVVNTATGTITAGAGFGVTAILGGGDVSIANSGTISAGAGGHAIIASANLNLTNTGSLSSSGASFVIDVQGNATINNGSGGSITTIGGFDAISIAGNGTVINAGTISGTTVAVGNLSLTNTGAISSSGPSTVAAVGNAVIDNGSGSLITNTNTVSGFAILIGGMGTIINAGTISSAIIAIQIDSGSSSLTNSGTIIGAVNFIGAGNTLTLLPGSNITGQVVGAGSDTFQLGGTGAATFDTSALGGTNQYQGFSTYNKIGTSTWELTGNGGTGVSWNVNGGTLLANGSILSPFTVNSGGTLGGSGTVGNTAINGGTLSPGNSIGTLTVSGSLTLMAASTYLVQISGTSADRTIVTGAANLAGKVTVDPLARIAATTTYTILTAGTVNGTFATAGLLTTNSFARNARLSYVGSDALLTVDPGLLLPNLPSFGTINQRNVAAGIDNALMTGSNMPTGFNGLFALSGDGLLNALTQASGETATGSQQTTFNAMNLFLGVLTDPFTAGRGGNAPGATGFAEDGAELNGSAAAGRKRTGSERDAYGMMTKAASRAPTFESRWSAWAAGFGGSQATDGNATLGSNTATSRVAGMAVGADYWLSPQTVAGFALAGGGTNFSVANGLGSGQSDLFQAGAFVRHGFGSAYITAAAAYGWQSITTDRTVTIAGSDGLHARFNANAYSGRVEGGNRYLTPWPGGIGLTPYAAVQVTAFALPSYAETVASGANTFALSYGGKTVTATRTELGLRSDKTYVVGDSLLTLRGRAAWAHDYNTDRNVAAAFQTLPGASFVVNGALPAHDAALTTASAEMKWINGWSAAATFEGEFSQVTRSYAGKGIVRYGW